MELLALFVSSLGHDLDHRGTNNQYQMSSVSKARPPTSMDYLVCFTCSWYTSHIQCPIYTCTSSRNVLYAGIFLSSPTFTRLWPISDMAFLTIKLHNHFQFVHWQRERILAKLYQPPKCPCIQFVHVYQESLTTCILKGIFGEM